MIDISIVRRDPTSIDEALARRGAAPVSETLVALDLRHRKIQGRLQEAQEERNRTSREIGAARKAGETADLAMKAVSALKAKIHVLEEEERRVAKNLQDALSEIPNIPDLETPLGKDDNDNVELRRWGTPRSANGVPEHHEIGAALGQMDFETAARLSGSRFVLLKDDLARLERALAAFMLDLHTQEHGYREISPPFLVTSDVMYGTGQLPKFADDLFQAGDRHWLIPTSEVPLTNIVRERIIDVETLPLRFTALTPCFRREAGAAGKDTHGMLRQHQFFKVEMVSITTPEQSDAELERKTACAETVLKRLELPYRVVHLCAGDLGFAARRTYDIEVWLPGQGAYREISSCSNTGSFQARRMKARFREKGEISTQFVHTLNGSGLATGRALIAVLENHWRESDGAVVIPQVLRPYMRGQTEITAHVGA